MKRPKKRRSLPMRIARLHGRLLGSFGFGILIFIATLPAPWQLATKLIAGWDAFGLVYLVSIYSVVREGDIAHLRTRAAEEDEGAVALLFLSCVAGFASLAAVVVELGSLKDANPLETLLCVAISSSTIVLSWAFVHTSFALHYAHEFYGEGRDRKTGGLKFPGGGSPDYWDFFYFSLVIAMTSQVSDIAVESRSLRRVVTVHGVLAFFFNLGVLALSINLMSQLIS